jgi:hypothetical protein
MLARELQADLTSDKAAGCATRCSCRSTCAVEREFLIWSQARIGIPTARSTIASAVVTCPLERGGSPPRSINECVPSR